MKRFSTIVMALALVLSLSQCKKNEQNNAEIQGEAVTITLDVSGATSGSATDGSRVVVNPNTGTVDFENNDQIIVASGGKYVGTLTYNGTLFTGAISNATEGYPLQFYFLGNVTPAETLTSGVTQSCSVVISDQPEHLPVISAASSNENYTASTTDYTAHLLNKCALVKFNVTTASEAAICVTGFNNKVTVNFAENTLTNSKEGVGIITLPAGNGEKWAILLPQGALEAGSMGTAYSHDFSYTGTRGAVPVIVENGYLTVGIPVFVATEVHSGGVFTGAINGKFTINSIGDQVYFSQGNLQYQASTNTWKFADNQWDYVGSQNPGYGNPGGTITGSDNSNISSTYSGWIDLFGWGTSGFNHGAISYQPWSTSNDDNEYYAYGDITYNLYDQTGQADWGYNAISNGSNLPNQWRTLTSDEWNYVFNTRSPLSGIRYAKAVVNDVKGVVLLPDDWNPTIYTLNNTNEANVAYTVNEITVIDWSILESSGAVFLPAAGYRFRTSVYYVGSEVHYWSASYVYDDSFVVAYQLSSLYGFNPHMASRKQGNSVRLVRDVE